MEAEDLDVSSDSSHRSCDSIACQNASKKVPTTKKAPGGNPLLTLGQFAVSKSETVVFGKLDCDPKKCPNRQYLLVLNSLALREFFGKKDSYTEAAKKAGAELEFTRRVATLKDTDWPKYQVIEVRSLTEDSLAKFERQLLAMNPDFENRVAFDPNKFTCAQATCRASSIVAIDLLGSSSTEEDDEEEAGSREKPSPRVSKDVKPKKAPAGKEKAADMAKGTGVRKI